EQWCGVMPGGIERRNCQSETNQRGQAQEYSSYLGKNYRSGNTFLRHVGLFGDVGSSFETANRPHTHQRRSQKRADVSRATRNSRMSEEITDRMNLAKHRDAEKQEADDHSAQDFRDHGKVVYQAGEADAKVIDQSCQQQSTHSRGNNIAIGICKAKERHQVAG